MGSSKILGGCDVRSQEFVPVQSCLISCQLAMSQSESAYSAIADWHWTTSNTPEVAIWAPYGDVGTPQRRNGDVRTWGHVGKIGPWVTRSLTNHIDQAPSVALAPSAEGSSSSLPSSRDPGSGPRPHVSPLSTCQHPPLSAPTPVP